MKTDTRVSFYLGLTIIFLTAANSHPTFGSVTVWGVISALVFILRWRSTEEGRAEVERVVEAVKRNVAG